MRTNQPKFKIQNSNKLVCTICVNLSVPYIHFNEQSYNLEHVVPARNNSYSVDSTSHRDRATSHVPSGHQQVDR